MALGATQWRDLMALVATEWREARLNNCEVCVTILEYDLGKNMLRDLLPFQNTHHRTSQTRQDWFSTKCLK